MARPKSLNRGKAVTIYLKGEHLDALKTIAPKPADAIRSLIAQLISGFCSRCARVGRKDFCKKCPGYVDA